MLRLNPRLRLSYGASYLVYLGLVSRTDNIETLTVHTFIESMKYLTKLSDHTTIFNSAQMVVWVNLRPSTAALSAPKIKPQPL